ncbi:FecR family protein [Rufibacter sp. DG15C]|uniref:FecR family protein n=1 Tax=Rufibacter sp. DG15C TaxID=1379909 RepID=UPI00082C97C0|nr:FecR family protein [Rufibacter sp. DG15C]
MNQELIDKYYKGACTPEEVTVVLEWFKSQELTPGQEEELKGIWAKTSLGTTDTGHDQDKAWRTLEAKIQNTAVEQESDVISIQRGMGKTWWQVAAAILLPIGFIWFLASYFNKPEVVEMVAVQAKAGEQKTINLEDGSTVVLRSGSKITYPKSFSSNKRDIALEGEAFFQVAKDKSRPFVVTSGVLLTQALGTSFNILYQPKDTSISVSLATGLVRISKQMGDKESKITNLSPGQQILFNSKNGQYAVSDFNSRETLGWKDGVLYFNHASLDEVVTRIENWYGVDVEVTGVVPGKGKSWSYTGEYIDQSLPKVLEGIGFVKNFTYEVSGEKVNITFN